MKFVTLLLSSLLLAACGGGGGGGAPAPAGPVASTQGFPLKTIYKNSFLDAVNHGYSLAGNLTITGAGSGAELPLFQTTDDPTIGNPDEEPAAERNDETAHCDRQ